MGGGPVDQTAGVRDRADQTVSTIERHWIDLWTGFGRVADGEVTETADRIHVKTRLGRIPYEHVLWCRTDDDQSCVDEILEAYSDRPAVWTIGPSSAPSDLEHRLRTRGCQPFSHLTGMTLELPSGPPDPVALPAGMEIVHVGDERLLEVWADLVIEQWHLSAAERATLLQIHWEVGFDPTGPARRWLVFREEIPVAKISAVFGDVEVGVYGVGTTEAARGSGIATAMTSHVLAEARREGLRTAVLHSTPMACRLYERLGFEARCEFSVLTLPSPRTSWDGGDLTRA